MGSRKVLESVSLKPTVFELNPYETFSEYTTRICYYILYMTIFCPNCGSEVRESDKTWVKEFGEIASKSVITRYFNYWPNT